MGFYIRLLTLLGCCGGETLTSNLDAVAKSAVRFTGLYAPNTFT